MRKELIAELGGVAVDAIPGAADDVAEQVVPAEERRAPAIDPAKQFEILNPKEIELRCEMFWVDWYCSADPPHVTTQDDEPKACSSRDCRSRDFQSRNRLDVEFFTLKLDFTELQVYRRKVFEHIEHYAQIVFAELLRHHPSAVLTLDWLQAHRGYYEAAVVSPQARNVLRELLAYLNPAQGALVDGMTDVALVMAGIAITRCRIDRITEMSAKKAMAEAQG